MMERAMTTTARAMPISRREFVRTASIGTAAISLPAWAAPHGSDSIRVGLVGCGGRGTGAAADALRADPGVRITALADVFSDRLASSLNHLESDFPDRVDVGEDRKFSGFDAAQRLIESDVDVVLLCTPPHFRPAHLRAAVSAGKHVFCEKPMAVDAPGVRSVLEAVRDARARNLAIVAGFCWRYSSAERETYKRIIDGQIGEVLCVHSTYHAGPIQQHPRQPQWSDMEWQLRNWWHFTWLSGDHIVEQACHSIDKINWAMNGVKPTQATCLGGRQAREGAESGNAYDHFAVVYEYQNGARCFHTCRQIANTPFDNTEYILGTKGTCAINGWAPMHVIKGQNPWSYEGERPNMYQVEHVDLFKSIRDGTPINDGEWMANSTMLAIMGRMAAYTGQTITWEQAMNSTEDLSPRSYEFGSLAAPTVAVPGKTSFI
jgi:predicted dehydrogenase